MERNPFLSILNYITEKSLIDRFKTYDIDDYVFVCPVDFSPLLFLIRRQYPDV